MLPPEDVYFTWVDLPRTVVPLGFSSRRRWLYVILHPKKRLFYVMLPPEDVDFTRFQLPKMLVLRGFSSRKPPKGTVP